MIKVLVLLAAALTAPSADFTGIVATSGCSGAVVRVASATPGDHALVLTNGHCVRRMAAGEVLVDQRADRAFDVLGRAGAGTLGTVRAERLLYATMTGTDVALYRLRSTYAEVAALGTRALDLAPAGPSAGTAIRVVSGYWRRVYSCRVDAVVPTLREDVWTWHDSIRYSPECDTVGGTSGSPVVDVASGLVVGVNNTANEDGARCTLDNPCEVAADGSVVVRRGIAYGQQTGRLAACVVRDAFVCPAAPMVGS
ncbi:serine protease [Actinosynnema sp. NPDC020468]|uniref:S1 family peptidase n=1 Tax=Actinosynnema sp. NPDC020468 TaxID=3154488 RepID=UPI0033D6C45F